MTSVNPPTYYFNGIQYNSAFFNSSSDCITLSQADSKYLGRQGNPISIATSTTFNNSLIAPTPTTSDNSTKVATTAYVKNQGYSGLSTNNTFTGTNAFTNTNTTAITQSSTDNSTKVATTAYVKSIASPANFLGLANSFFYS
jgi:hypothetical protein